MGIDRADMLEMARQRALEAQLTPRLRYVGGDLRELDWGVDHDVVILSHVLHGYEASVAQELVKRAYRALGRGGTLIINEFLPNHQDLGQTPMQALFGLQMLLTSGGRAHFLADYRGWALAAGFSELTVRDVPGPSTLLLARRAA